MADAESAPEYLTATVTTTDGTETVVQYERWEIEPLGLFLYLGGQLVFAAPGDGWQRFVKHREPETVAEQIDRMERAGGLTALGAADLRRQHGIAG